MKCLTIQQPFASLIMLGVKQYETRKWVTPYRGPLLIHAARQAGAWAQTLATQWPFNQILREELGIKQFHDLPQGVILGCVTLQEIDPTRTLKKWINHTEERLGFWHDGNFAWKLDQPHRWSAPLACSGQPGLWEIDDARIRAHLAVVA